MIENFCKYEIVHLFIIFSCFQKFACFLLFWPKVTLPHETEHIKTWIPGCSFNKAEVAYSFIAI